jgi:hypothetical protein
MSMVAPQYCGATSSHAANKTSPRGDSVNPAQTCRRQLAVCFTGFLDLRGLLLAALVAGPRRK